MTDNLWYKDAIIYQLHVRSFFDSNSDGIGDFRGLIEKLDYLKDLGVTALWLLPFYPSPLKDDGYDIADYYRVNPDYGTVKDFKLFLREAHRRGLRVITEVVLNHTSDQHEWFKRARISPKGSQARDFYVWRDTPEGYPEVRIIFKDFETSNWAWDPVAKAYYWHRFYSNQPDLNFDSPQVRRAMFKVADFWLDMGVDGLRLDAIPYLYEREGTNCENLPETYEYIRQLRAHMDSRFGDRMFLAEANQWPEDAVAYFGSGDMCHMAFHFPLMPRMYISLQMEDRFPIIDILDQTPTIPDACQWAIFLRNHDELTLEMVTDEERDYMYRVYARDSRSRINLGIRRRLAPLLSGDRKKIELMNVLLFTLPGTPVIYYGDEIGMGDNYYLGDRNGVRTPMQWSPDRNSGFSRANPQKLYLPVIIDPEYHYESINVETQERNTASLLWWMKRLISTRKSIRALSRGALQMLYPSNPKVLAFTRSWEDETVLTVVNFSRFSQAVELDLARFAGYRAEELFGRNAFPHVRETPYPLTLGGYDTYLFLLTRVRSAGTAPGGRLIVETARGTIPGIPPGKGWKHFPDEEQAHRLEEEVLPGYLMRCRWFGGKSLVMRKVRISERIPFPPGYHRTQILILEVDFTDGSTQRYMLPLSLALEGKKDRIADRFPAAVVATVREGGVDGCVYDAVYDEDFARALLGTITERRRAAKGNVRLSASCSKRFQSVLPSLTDDLPVKIMNVEQTNSSVLFGNVAFLKIYRQLEGGMNPEIETSRFLTEKAGFVQTPMYYGSVELSMPGGGPASVSLLQGFVPNQGDGWTYTLDTLAGSFDRVLAEKPDPAPLAAFRRPLMDVRREAIPKILIDMGGSFYFDMVELLGRRTGELHRALASAPDDVEFKPEPFSTLYQRSLYQSMRGHTRRSLQSLQRSLGSISETARRLSEELLRHESEILERQHAVAKKKIDALKIRNHGDYHLGQVLFTGKDFTVIDFEGEPARPLSERRIKRCPLRDVAGMIRSFHYAVHMALRRHVSRRPEDAATLAPWVEPWYLAASGLFLSAYLDTVEKKGIVPADRKDTQLLLSAYLLEKAVYEITYELNNRPDWVEIPIRGMLQILEASDDHGAGLPVADARGAETRPEGGQ